MPTKHPKHVSKRKITGNEFRLYTAQFLLRDAAIRFQNSVISAYEHSKLTSDVVGVRKGEHLAMTKLKALSDAAKESVDAHIKSSDLLLKRLDEEDNDQADDLVHRPTKSVPKVRSQSPRHFNR